MTIYGNTETHYIYTCLYMLQFYNELMLLQSFEPPNLPFLASVLSICISSRGAKLKLKGVARKYKLDVLKILSGGTESNGAKAPPE